MGFALSSLATIVATLVIFVGTIAVTYTLCLKQDHCEIFLPTISHTWERPPGSYLSRITISIGCFLLALLQWVVFFVNKSRPGTKIDPSQDIICLVGGVFASFCLSIVAAVCDSSAPSCQGNNSLHSFAAVTYFVIYDFQMAYITLKYRNAILQSHHRFRATLTSLSLLSKLRYFILLGDETPLAIVEWANVLIIMLYFLHFFAANGQGYFVGVANQEAPGRFQVLGLVSSRSLAAVSLFVWATVLSGSFLSANKDGRIDPSQVWPALSDLWTAPSGNYYGRWGLMLCAILGAVIQASVLLVETRVSAALKTSAFASWLVAFACLGASGAINAFENEHANHALLAGFLSLASLSQAAQSVASGTWSSLLLVPATALCHAQGLWHQLEGTPVNVLQWVDLALILFFSSMYVYHLQGSDQTGLFVGLEDTDTSVKKGKEARILTSPLIESVP